MNTSTSKSTYLSWLPSDVLLIIWRFVHNDLILNLNNEYIETFEDSFGAEQGFLRSLHVRSGGMMFNYRRLDDLWIHMRDKHTLTQHSMKAYCCYWWYNNICSAPFKKHGKFLSCEWKLECISSDICLPGKYVYSI